MELQVNHLIANHLHWPPYCNCAWAEYVIMQCHIRDNVAHAMRAGTMDTIHRTEVHNYYALLAGSLIYTLSE